MFSPIDKKGKFLRVVYKALEEIAVCFVPLIKLGWSDGVPPLVLMGHWSDQITG